MSIEQRKIQLVQTMLRLEDEQIIDSVEKLIKDLQLKSLENDFKPLTQKQLNARIDASEADFANGRFTSAEALLKKF